MEASYMNGQNEVTNKDVDDGLIKKIDNVFKIFNIITGEWSELIFAYSGGKDSTLLLLLFYRWLKSKNSHQKKYSITLLHNDTFGEINPMELWAREFMQEIARRIRDMGHEVEIIITAPPAVDTFYWRVLVRGYPAPTYNFRWCVKLLKLQPTKRSLKEILDVKNDPLLLLGSRETESISRRRSLNTRYGGCPMGPGKCHAYYFSTEANGINKVAPLRDWTNTDVWTYLRTYDGDVNISNLLFLYGCEEARYGCWHCTLIKTQWGLKVLPENYQYFDAVRLIYRMVSDIPSLRIRKSAGYSTRGALTAVPRSLLLHLFQAAEEESGVKLYGLDESRVSDGYSLRQVFYELEEDKAMEIILKEDKFVERERLIDIGILRDLKLHSKEIRWLVNKLTKHPHCNRYIKELLDRIIEKID
jgi:DNA sulfur modification protein DndC